MPYIQWTDDFDVEIKEINEQHKHLIDILNLLYNRALNGESQEDIHSAIAELSNYSITHFETEEKYLEEFEYPEIEIHKIKHRTFINKIVDFKYEYSSGKDNLAMDILSYLTDWLRNHILIEDKKYSDFVKQKGVS